MPKQQLVKTTGLSFGAGQTADLEGITSREFASGSGAKLDESTLQHYVRGRLSDASIASALDEQGCQALLELSLRGDLVASAVVLAQQLQETEQVGVVWCLSPYF